MKKWARAGSMVAIATAMMLSVALPAQAFAPPPGPAIATLFEDSVGILAGAEGASVTLGPADAVAAPAEAGLWAAAFGVGAAGIAVGYAIQPQWTATDTANVVKNLHTTNDGTPMPTLPADAWQPQLIRGQNSIPNDVWISFLPEPNMATDYPQTVGDGEDMKLVVKLQAECTPTNGGAPRWASGVYADNSNWNAGNPNTYAQAYKAWGIYASTVCYNSLGSGWNPAGPIGAGPATQYDAQYNSNINVPALAPQFTLPGTLGQGGVPGSSPTGTFSAQSSCTLPDGSVQFFINTAAVTDGFVTYPRCQDVLPGSVQTGGVIANQPTADAPPIPVETWDVKPQPNYPECDPTLAKTCKFSIILDGQPCVAGVKDCEGWTTVRDTQPTRVQCKWGPYLVDIKNCNLLERGYYPGGAPATPGNTDGDPTTGTNFAGAPWDPPATQPRAVPAGWPSNDPSPSAPPAVDPSSNPSQSPSPSAPAPGSTPVPGGAGQPSPSDPSGNECFPNGWAMLNPVEWVLKPVGCALSAAFVPSPEAVQALTDGVATDIAQVGIRPISDSVGGIFAAVPASSGGCQGPMFHFEAFGIVKDFYPLNACDDPLRTMASMCNAISTVGVIVGGGLALLRALSAGFGYRFTMGGKA